MSVNVRLQTNFDAAAISPSPAQLRRALQTAASEIEATIRERTARGAFARGTKPRAKRYSTRPHFFRVPKGVRGVSRLRRVNRTRGRAAASEYVRFERGYAEFRSTLRGEAYHESPVTLELTGRMMRGMKGVVRNGRAQVEFSDTRLGGDRRSPREKARIHDLRGTPSRHGRLRREFLFLTPAEAERITGRALRSAGLPYLRRSGF